MNDPSKVTYGEISSLAPQELRAFSLLVGKWDGEGKTRLEDGSFAEFPVQCIGRSILNGTAIAGELHSIAPYRSPWFSRISKSWTGE